MGPFVNSLLERNQRRREEAKQKEEQERQRLLEEVKRSSQISPVAYFPQTLTRPTEKELEALQADKPSDTTGKKVLSKEEKQARDRLLAQVYLGSPALH